MRPRDFITIINFATNVTVWERVDGEAILPASLENIEAATRHVEQLEAEGETNINGALLQALEIVSETQEKKMLRGVQPMVLFLTDGHPTVGETDTLRILHNVKKANLDTKTAVFSLAFGRKTDFSMLRLLSVQNFGFARKIYTAADASLQLEGFYQEVSSPILSNVTFDYLDSNLVEDSLTDTAFHTFYQGGEMVVAGMVDVDAVMPVFEYEITAHHTAGEYRASGDTVQAVEMVDTYIDVLPSFNMSDYNYMERMWAYLSVRSLLTKVERGQLYSCQPGYQQARYQDDGDVSSFAEPIICNNLERALLLSLKYQFVTPLTSLVVIKPDVIEDGDIQEADMFNRKIRVMSGARNHHQNCLNIMVIATVILKVIG